MGDSAFSFLYSRNVGMDYKGGGIGKVIFFNFSERRRIS